MSVTDKNARIVACSLWPFYSYCCWELTNNWPPFATERCRDFELCISRFNVRFSLVYYRKYIFFKLLFNLLLVDVSKGLLTFLIPSIFLGTLSEFGDSNKECGVYAILSLPFDLPHEHIFLPLWTVQLRPVRLCKHYPTISLVHRNFTWLSMQREYVFCCQTSGPKWDRSRVGDSSIGVVLLLQSSCQRGV